MFKCSTFSPKSQNNANISSKHRQQIVPERHKLAETARREKSLQRDSKQQAASQL
jgi:hypothetical protein